MDPTNLNLVLQWRAIERFADVVIGAMAIYLGYKLFMNLPEKRETQDGEMKLLLPGNISVYASRVAPGIFFALFGTAMVLMSFVSPLKLDGGSLVLTPAPPKTQDQTDENPQTIRTSFSYLTGKAETERVSTDRSAVLRDLAALRELESALNASLASGGEPEIGPEQAATLINTLQRVKLSLMLAVWDENWGNAETFAAWAGQGGFSQPPASVQPAADLFLAPPKEGSP